jgi:hypothetical protein
MYPDDNGYHYLNAYPVTVAWLTGCRTSLVNVHLLCPCKVGRVGNPYSLCASHARTSYRLDTRLSSLTCYLVRSDPRGPGLAASP